MPESATILLLDVDGVLTDEFARVDAEVIRLLVDLITRGTRVALISGRSRVWIEERIVPSLLDAATDPSAQTRLERIVIAAEMGAVCRVGVAGGEWQMDRRYRIRPELRSTLRRLCEAECFAPFLFWDGTKDVIATVEARADTVQRERAFQSLVDFEATAGAIAAPYGCRAARSTYTLDVLPLDLSKEVGARFALRQMLRKGEAPTVLVLGDSHGDILMATSAREAGLERVRFVWLGEGPAPEAMGVAVCSAPLPYAHGTRRVLSALIAGLPAVEPET